MDKIQPEIVWKNIFNPIKDPKFHIKLIILGVGISKTIIKGFLNIFKKRIFFLFKLMKKRKYIM